MREFGHAAKIKRANISDVKKKTYTKISRSMVALCIV